MNRLKKLLEQQRAKLAELEAAAEAGDETRFAAIEAELAELDSQIKEARAQEERLTAARAAVAEHEERAAAPMRPPVHTEPTVTGGEARDRFSSLAQQCLEARHFVLRGTPIHGGVMEQRLRETGQVDFPISLGRQIRAATGAGINVSADGGALVQEDFAAEMMPVILDPADLPGMARKQDVGGNRLVIVRLKSYDKSSSFTGVAIGYWVDEGGTVTASNPTFERASHELRSVAALIYATEELLEDAPQFDSVLAENVPLELRMCLADKIINGSGTGEPEGILNAACLKSIAKETDQTAQTLLSENVIKMDAAFLEFNMASVAWLYNRGLKTQFPLLNLAVGVGGALVYLNPTMGIAGPQPASLLGKPMVACQYCAARGTVGDLILADMSQYVLGLKNGGQVRGLSSIHVAFTTRQSAFMFTLRADGRPKHSAVITPKNCVSGETLSPFVGLATRA